MIRMREEYDDTSKSDGL